MENVKMWECGRYYIMHCALWECENARMWECGHVSMWEWWTMSTGHIALCGEKDCCEGVIMLPGQTAYCLANGYKRGLFYHGFSLFRFNKKKMDKWYDKVYRDLILSQSRTKQSKMKKEYMTKKLVFPNL